MFLDLEAHTRNAEGTLKSERDVKFLRDWNLRTIQTFNGRWVIGEGLDPEGLFGPGGQPHALELFKNIDGKEHYYS